MKLENWVLVHKRYNGEIGGNLVLPNHAPRTKCFVQGKVYGNSSFRDGDFIRTSSVVEFSMEKIRTYSGSIYELGTPNKDYESFIEAYKSGVPIIKRWRVSLDTGIFTGNVFVEGDYDFESPEGKIISGEVASQDYINNLITIKGLGDFFVDWTSLSDEMFFNIVKCKFYNVDSLKEFASTEVKPNFYGDHKSWIDKEMY